MIVVDTPAPDSDAVSTTTLVTSSKIPRFFLGLICFSIPVSLIGLICSAFNNPIRVAATVVPFVFTLPYQAAGVLLVWLHRHQTDSILPFTPTSRRSIIYCVFLALLWIASAVVTGIEMFDFLRPNHTQCGNRNGRPSFCTWYKPHGGDLVPPILAFVVSFMEVVTICATAVVCILHRRKKGVTTRPETPMMSEFSDASGAGSTKVISP